MFKKILIGGLLIGLVGVLAAGAVIRTTSQTAEAQGQGHGRGGQAISHEAGLVGQGRGGQATSHEVGLVGQGRGGRWGQAGAEHASEAAYAPHDALAPAAGPLSQAEVEGLLYMREEEKLAHNVYLALYQQWGMSLFQNIASSEQSHADAVKTLLERYNLQDPAAGQAAGVFANATLQELYEQLTAQGRQSPADALQVGAAIEELDILDLQQRLTQTSHADIQAVYRNLLQGSANHLQAFTSNLARQTGETYQPQYLSQADYQALVGNALTRGGRGRRGQ